MIKIDIDMPKSCWGCKFAYYDSVYTLHCPFDDMGVDMFPDDRLENCPLIDSDKESKIEQEDCISRQAVLDEIENGIKAGNYEEGYEEYTHINDMDDIIECIKYADSVQPKAEQEDCISRQAVLDEISKSVDHSLYAYKSLMECVKTLPSVTPQEPKTNTLDKIRAEIEEHAYPVRYGYNSIEKGMTLTGINQVIDKYRQEG